MNENEKAYEALEQAVALSVDSLEISSIHMNLAQLDASKGNNSKARTHALTSVKYDEINASKAYSLIGDLYLSSTCSSEDVLKTKAKYIAAYDMYVKAGNSEQASVAKKYFPTTADVFNYNKSVGDVQLTGCWIAESVKLKVQ